ncbi:MAG TPA: hypothetical protein PLK76_02370 [bacterium]|nr:hypothetical protein [bacterium]
MYKNIWFLFILLTINLTFAQEKDKGIPNGFEKVTWEEICQAINYNWDQKTGILTTAGAYVSCVKDFHKIPTLKNVKETAWFNTPGIKQIEALALADGYLKESFLPSLLQAGLSRVKYDSVRVYQFFNGEIYCKRFKK